MSLSKMIAMVMALLVFNVNAGLKPKDIHPGVTVVWHNPADFKDVEVADGIQKRYLAKVLDNFEKYFHKELPKYLNPGQKIKLTIFDLDLAGDVRPMLIQGRDVRLVTSVYPPMMDVEYTISDGQGNVIRTVRKRLRDLAFDMGSGTAFSGQALQYEKVMLKRWFKKELR